MAKIVLNTQHYCHLVDKREIVYCKADSHKTRFILTDGREIFFYKPLRYSHEQLCCDFFIYTHRAYLINIKHLVSIHQKPALHAIMSNNHKVPMAKSRKKEILNRIKKQLMPE